jgi:hypothetical protein
MPERNPRQFVFDLDRGISTQAVEQLENSPLLPQTKGAGPDASGIYGLYYKGNFVYIGKALAAGGIAGCRKHVSIFGSRRLPGTRPGTAA